jgi:hypothetical protein
LLTTLHHAPCSLTRPPTPPAQAAEKGFWHNNVTGESTWKQPDAMGVSTPDGKSRYWIVDGEPSWQPPAEYAWRAVPSTDPSHNGRVRARAAAAAAAAACVASVVARARRRLADCARDALLALAGSPTSRTG